MSKNEDKELLADLEAIFDAIEKLELPPEETLILPGMYIYTPEPDQQNDEK